MSREEYQFIQSFFAEEACRFAHGWALDSGDNLRCISRNGKDIFAVMKRKEGWFIALVSGVYFAPREDILLAVCSEILCQQEHYLQRFDSIAVRFGLS